MRELPKEFAVEAPDDAMAPDIRRGRRCEFVLFDEGMALTDEDIVLVHNPAGDWYMRRYVPLGRDHWLAAAGRESSVPPMDSKVAGLKIIAVLTKIVRRAV